MVCEPLGSKRNQKGGSFLGERCLDSLYTSKSGLGGSDTEWLRLEAPPDINMSVRLIAEPLGKAKIILTWTTEALAQKGHNHSYWLLCAKPHRLALRYWETHSHLWWIRVPSLMQHWPFCCRLSPEMLGYRKRKASRERKVKVIVIQLFFSFLFYNVSFLQYSRLMNGPFRPQWQRMNYCHCYSFPLLP